MRSSMRFALGLFATVLFAPSVLDAHFTLMEPASWLVENQLGDPQKGTSRAAMVRRTRNSRRGVV